MTNANIPLPDEATPHAAARTRLHFESSAGGHTLVGWLGRYLVLVLLLAAGLASGRVLGRALYHLMN